MHSLRVPALLLIVGILVTQFVQSGSLYSIFTQAVIYAIFALGIGILLRQNGLVSFGHALYFGMAGYGMGILLAGSGMPAEAAMLLVLLVMGLSAFLIGLVIVRVPGIAFSMLTLAMGQMSYLLASRARGVTGGADGMGIAWPAQVFGVSQSVLLKPPTFFLISWCIMVAVLLVVSLILATRFGSISEAIRDNEERARFIGIRTTVPRALIYALSAVVTGIAGLLSSLNSGFISPESLHWSVSAIALLMVIVGGFRQLAGPIVGAIVYVLIKDVLGDLATHSMAIFGTALIIVIVFAPEGIAGVLRHWLRRPQTAASANELPGS
ncbi:MAG: branched-chain amino acid ABC transporter permease [Castellaniella sp.]